MEKKKNSAVIGALKYIAKTLTLTLLVIVIVVGLALVFVFVTTKVAQSKKQDPPVNLFTIISPSMTPNINVYDVVVTVKTDPAKIQKNDVISFYSSNPQVGELTITHRVIDKIQSETGEYVFRTKGDYNEFADQEAIFGKAVVGKVYFKVPQLGRIQFFLGSKGGWLIAILIPALGIIAYDIYKIIKLILIKQKIVAYQNQEDLSNAESNSISTIYDSAKDELTKNSEEMEQEPIKIISSEEVEPIDKVYDESKNLSNADNALKEMDDLLRKIKDDNK